jgi:two-component system response regulator NreC
VSTTIVLADDHPVVRRGLRALLDAQTGFVVVGEAGEGQAALALVERQAPQVLVVDLMMPGLSGLEVTRQVTRRFPGTRVIVLSMYGSEGYVLEALRNGAAGYVLKDASSDEVVRGIREVAAGRRYLSPPLSDHAIETYARRERGEPMDSYDTLTTREREILQMSAEGGSSGVIAERLSISPRTVETHRANLMRKLGLRNQTDLIRFALQRGILSLQ